MKSEIVILVLAMAFAGCAAAFLITLAKLQEEKERRWDKTSLALTIEKEKNKEIETLNEWNRSFENRGDFWYDTSEKLVHERDALQDRLSDLQTKLEREKAYFESCRAGNHALQDKLSALLCPHNDHVWKDGCCVKCGRMKDD